MADRSQEWLGGLNFLKMTRHCQVAYIDSIPSTCLLGNVLKKGIPDMKSLDDCSDARDQ